VNVIKCAKINLSEKVLSSIIVTIANGTVKLWIGCFESAVFTNNDNNLAYALFLLFCR